MEAAEDVIERLFAECGEWKRRYEGLMAAVGPYSTHEIALKSATRMISEREALAIQLDAMREALEKSEGCEGCYLHARAALALDATRAGKIAEVRRKVCEMMAQFGDSQGFSPEDPWFPIRQALAELRKAESGDPT